MKKDSVLLSDIVVKNGLQTGPFGSQLKLNEFTSHGVPIVMPKDIRGGKISEDTISRTSIEKTKKLTKHQIKAGDIIFPRRGDLGRIAVATECNEGWICGTGCLRARIIESIDKNYIHQYVQMPFVVKWLEANALGQTMLNLNTKILGNLPIYCPNYEIQKHISRILAKWDTAIQKTEALIAAKKKLFGWLVANVMNTSSGNWFSCLLKEISQIKKGQQLNRDTLLNSGLYPVWNGGMTPSGFTDKRNTSANTITISEGGNSCGFVSFCEKEFWLGGHCYALEKIDPKISTPFLFYFLKAKELEIMKLRVGSGLPNIQKKDIEKTEVSYPSFEKQLYISCILNTAQKEIALLEKLVEKYRLQKKGLMQKLLTGEWRIKETKETKL